MARILECKPLKDWLKAWRLGNRLTVQAAADRFGVSKQAYLHWELGDNLPYGPKLQLVMVTLKLSIEEIDFGG